MPFIKVNKQFKHSDDGNAVNTYEVGEHEVSDRCAEVAIDQLEVAELIDAPEEPEPKAPAKKAPAKKAPAKKPTNGQ
ncbi:hypothetical protein [Neptuniibacter sp.]|uniref:hypothetical protein n=1 Tax=Neptuniibacter sp. TaxID=1962643 RepID=UPI002611F7EE|nr:hypothetical protein [Neptuniibacter sp.]